MSNFNFNMMGSRPITSQVEQPMYDLDKTKRIKELHSKIYFRSRSKNDILCKIGADLRKDIEYAKKIKEQESVKVNSTPKVWIPSVLKENPHLELDLDLLPLLPQDMKKYTLYKQQFKDKNNKSNVYNTESQFNLHSRIDQRKFYTHGMEMESNTD